MKPIVIAPFSHSDIRDWPADHYGALIGLLLRRWSGPVRIVGSPGQAIRAAALVRPYDAGRVINDCGAMPWPDVVGQVRRAACVIGNNSGIVHLAGHFGVPAVCIFSGAHQRAEWRPAGDRTVTLTRTLACAPCHLHVAVACPYDIACLRQIAPEEVAETVLTLIDRQNTRIAHAG